MLFRYLSRTQFNVLPTNSFTEYFVDSVDPLTQAVALFGMYTFFMTQPSTSGPTLQSVNHIMLPVGMSPTSTTRVSLIFGMSRHLQGALSFA